MCQQIYTAHVLGIKRKSDLLQMCARLTHPSCNSSVKPAEPYSSGIPSCSSLAAPAVFGVRVLALPSAPTGHFPRDGSQASRTCWPQHKTLNSTFCITQQELNVCSHTYILLTDGRFVKGTLTLKLLLLSLLTLITSSK